MPPRTPPTVLHLIPYDGIGGVEVAARSLAAGPHGTDSGALTFAKLFLSCKGGAAHGPHVWTGPQASEWAPGNYLGAVSEIRRRKPDLVIVSLWRSCIAALLAKALRPRLRLVAFLHLAESVHLPDRLLNRLVMELAVEIWADSDSTLRARLPARLRRKGRVISFLTERMERATRPPARPHFIFWGRLHPQKGLSRALQIFAAVAARHTEAQFTLIGPDMGIQAALQEQARTLGVDDRVTFAGPLDRAEIFRQAGTHCFYLQPSVTEGMAMSVVEAMQLGLIPVVTPVGEIPRYARDDDSALFLPPDEPPATSAARIADLLADPARSEAMARTARAVWQDRALYRDDVLRACRALLDRANGATPPPRAR
ncbi:glycosyltransferase family 4 protein [Rhodovulum adriaticum]|uniref:Glycosyltransferase involved in cell wall biosynthesis n=1 Tax=Rhodovulum adriaticum TaxID=35804 RepID=A0A4R2NY99_RHOAD|nr:glycosyltransferase family 4 protein [Rhodovulum adriaticum]MBK1634206.1 hypothetical protein [Rhodovulum adriaticum]TCP27243.1 glycosyltransferase involved in cell wall biosynthesis [Rhodovulum adriaticum]